MTLRSGLAASVGFGDESTWGVAVAPSVWVPLVNESITADIARLESEGIHAGRRLLTSNQWSEGAVTAGGDVGLELNDESKALLLKHMTGSTSSPYTPADLAGLGLTVQVGVPDQTDGTVRPKTLAGGKITSFEIAATAGEIVTLGLSLVGRHIIHHRTVADGVLNETTTVTSATAAFNQDDVGKPISATGIPASTTIASVESATSATLSAAATATASSVTLTLGLALTSVSYDAALKPFRYQDTTVTIAGSAVKSRALTISGDNGYDTERTYLGQRTIDEPLEEGLRVYGGTIETEYWNNTAYNRFLSGAEAALVSTFSRGSKSLIITQNVRFDGETAQVGGRERVGQNLPFTAIGSSADADAFSAALDES